MIGRLLSGRYLIEQIVGTGGMAVVYRATDTEQNITVAVKVLKPEYETDMEFVDRFSREAEAAAKMAHENIVNLLDVGIDGEQRYIVMEFVDGVTLKEMIRREGRIDPERALLYAIRILAAVNHAHRNGIVHRDIKPQNILINENDDIKVADFGIARLKTLDPSVEKRKSEAVGSVHYLSPEQAAGEIADEQSDLYSVGIVLYEMLTGKVPFDGKTVAEIARKHVSQKPASMRKQVRAVTPALEEVVMRALSKDKALRYANAEEMAADLREAYTHPEGGFVVYPETETKESEEEKPRRWSKLKKALVFTLLSLILLALAAGLVYYRLEIMNRAVMPDLIGMDGVEAQEELAGLGFTVTPVNAYSEDYDAGRVMLQPFEAGQKVRQNTPITLTISLGTQWYELKDLSGKTAEEAEEALRKNNVSQVTKVYTISDAPVGTVVSQSPVPGIESRDTPVTLIVSGKSVTVPSLVGVTLEGARTVLAAEGLVVGEIREAESADAEEGTVIDQGIAPYSRVLCGVEVSLTVCALQEMTYAPEAPLTVVVPLEQLRVRAEIVTPSGQTVEAYVARLSMGTHTIELESPEKGIHTVRIYMGEVLMETMQVDFE